MLVDKYRVDRLLGDGGMGAVYLAEHVVLGRRAAIKVLHPHITGNAEIVQRFINEAIGAASLNHRNIIHVLDCGQLPGSGAWYIALEFLDGESLGSFLDRQGGPVELATILHIMVEACNGLHAAHERNYVHRDVKPDNLYLTRTDDDPVRVVVLDFGIAKLNQPAQGVATRSNVVMGTPAYMAPEQLRDSKDVDRLADVFALGVILYEMLTGTRPWGSTTSLYDIIAQHAQMRSPPDPRDRNAAVPASVAAVVMRAMEPDPDRRLSSAKDLGWALAEATPMPYSSNGIPLLEQYARELGRSSTDSMTVGRRVPSELVAGSAPILPSEPGARPLTPATLSDGVPRGPGWTPPPAAGTQVMPADTAAPARPISTIAGSSGQVERGEDARPSGRRWLLGAVAVAGLGVGAIAAALVATGGDDRAGKRVADAATAAATSRDAGPATPAMTTLTVETTPPRATVLVDGQMRGQAPVSVSLPPDAQVVVRAELDGYQPVEQPIVVRGGSTMRVPLTLAPELDAGEAVDVAPTGKTRRSHTSPRTGSGSGDRAGTGTGAGSGTPDHPFNPDDVL
ncbi:MAG: protein kinase [Myxococcales bacterium]|nr:protein kinase [Myxococcales bacterium]